VTHKTALDLATAAFKRKDWKEAAQYAEVAAKTDDDGVRAEAWLLAGESDLKLKRFPAAAKAFEAVGAGTNVDASVRFRALAGLGLAREEQKDWRAALTAYESVAAKSPDPSLREWARERAAFVKTRLGQPAPKSKGRS
jgi:tetratricopeptide (TPR) repeat protein